MTDTSREVTLGQVLCIRYLVRFRRKDNENQDKDVKDLIDSDSKVNAMYFAYATKLGLCVRKIDVGAQKIDESHLDTLGMIIADCSVKNQLRRVQFF